MSKKKNIKRGKYNKNTIDVIKKAFFELLKKDEINKITVTSICKLANINRATFYKYYLDIYDLKEKVENEIYQEFQISVECSLTNETTNEFILKVINQIYDNKDICKILLTKNGNKDFIKKIFYLANDKFLIEWKNKLKNISEKELNYMFIYMANGSIGILQDWINNNYSDTKEYISNLITIINDCNMKMLTDELQKKDFKN